MFLTCEKCQSAYDCTSEQCCKKDVRPPVSIEMFAELIWRETYPERRNWNELEQSTRDEWIRFATVARNVSNRLNRS